MVREFQWHNPFRTPKFCAFDTKCLNFDVDCFEDHHEGIRTLQEKERWNSGLTFVELYQDIDTFGSKHLVQKGDSLVETSCKDSSIHKVDPVTYTHTLVHEFATYQKRYGHTIGPYEWNLPCFWTCYQVHFLLVMCFFTSQFLSFDFHRTYTYNNTILLQYRRMDCDFSYFYQTIR